MPPSDQSRRKRRRSNSQPTGEDTPARLRKRSTACHPCHSRKIKCPGGEPCRNCEQSETPQECTYPVRDHKVTVSNNYLNELRAENERLAERLREQQALSQEARPITTAIAPEVQDATSNQEPQDSAQNPLLDGQGRSWFVPLNTSGSLGHVGESADTAFVTRFRQAAAGDDSISHFPRTHYVSDGKLAMLADINVPWPALPRARLLVRFALDTVGSCYHCVRRSEINSGLKQHYRNLPTFDTAFSCKLWALFAMGEVFSARSKATSEDDFPGINYYARASRIMRGLRERPQIEMIEVYLLLSIYSLLINRRYTAHFLASSAMRLGVIMGLNLDVPEHQYPDRAAREHRTRLFWTIYIVDRLFASKMGNAASIQDEDIYSEMPSDDGLTEAEMADFVNVDHINAAIKLVRIGGDVISTIYTRRALSVPFSRRVQKALSELRAWVSDLPQHLRIDNSKTTAQLRRHAKWLHLTFNQYAIIVTRPVLLHVFKGHKDLWLSSFRTSELKEKLGETPLALAEACIRCARHSLRMLTDSWIDGSLAMFDYNYTQYLFSAASILGVSILSIGQNDQDDLDAYDSAYHFLQVLKANGNFGAIEYCQHLDFMKQASESFLSSRASNVGGIGIPPDALRNHRAVGITLPHNTNSEQALHLLSTSTTPISSDQPAMTAEMALAEPSLQDFLAQSEMDLSFLDTQMKEGRFPSLYFPVNLEDSEWMPSQNELL